jgi:hypothetical protein
MGLVVIHNLVRPIWVGAIDFTKKVVFIRFFIIPLANPDYCFPLDFYYTDGNVRFSIDGDVYNTHCPGIFVYDYAV